MQLRHTGETPTTIATASAAFMGLLFLGFSGMLLWALLGAFEFAFGVAPAA